jgi:glyoxylase-like metal-dependent hydrolase (beta-lactamase superfamily II)
VLDRQPRLRADRQRARLRSEIRPHRTASADRLIARVAELGATVHWMLETHVHADHLSAAPYLKAHSAARSPSAAHRRVQEVFGTLFNAGPGFAHDGSQFDHLFDDGDTPRSAR